MTRTPTEAATKDLRIACLLPSATDICVALGLSQQIVGITHECHFHSSDSNQKIHILTRDGLQAADKTQMEIHVRVQEQQQMCRMPKEDTISSKASESVPSLYPIDVDALRQAAPDLIITQDLCAVCAPSVSQVKGLLRANNTTRILSLSPQSLSDVLQTFVTIATACGVPERGIQLRDTLQQQLHQLKSIIHSFRRQQPSPRLLFLEWLDPPFDAGHWILDMMEYAGLQNAFDNNQQRPRKSGVRSWDAITNTTSPDVILIACCGFDVERNAQDAVTHSHHLQRVIAASRNANAPIYATNGDRYFTCPGPQLVTVGVVLLAMAAYRHEYPDMIAAIQALPWVQMWLPDDLTEHYLRPVTLSSSPTVASLRTVDETRIADIEDCPNAGCDAGKDCVDDTMGHSEQLGWDKLHDEACQARQLTYTDPDSGYSVFTELAHRQRGKCCGSGCRHCPYHHMNVRDKATKIQQPAWLFLPTTVEEHDVFTSLSQAHNNVRVLFFSGGKDSFLTIRALARQAARFPLVLLTTFDATSRVVAHQEVSIQQILRQAQHLQLPLLGVPLHRHHANSNSLSYVQRIQQALAVIEEHVAKVTGTTPGDAIHALVFGDLHLEHIRDWRKDQLGGLYRMEYPLWKVDYATLAQDLELSSVPCIVSSSTVDTVQVGERYDALFRERLKAAGATIDLFGENGEFHTLAQVWEVDWWDALGYQYY
ncbi:hypothetical protein FisN_30Lh115 [Fistulifera solaris]|uniref:Fe/B12 periplasmic-binding domain-containing protein n=1 Tax=Fistulifera solaris TaxID=1519565 RepID=A0A1Z5JII1_FISSO|nr:hypothetical protein FisN_30Lh115 [Fistulifera solaris]|eukprot:GAX13820.1 hypothetical protein FisN_30Lh115 [Fistulifera solaris]